MKKSNWIVLGLIVVLGTIYFATREKEVSVGIKRLELPQFVVDNADHIEIKGKDIVVLKKENDKWLLDLKTADGSRMVAADQANVKSMLDSAKQISHSHYVTNLKDKMNELGFSEQDAVVIKISSHDKIVWNLMLGKNTNGSGRYAKLPDSDDIYVVRGSFWQLTRNAIADWRDKEFFPVKEGEASALSLYKANVPEISVVKTGEEWDFSEQQKGLLQKDFRVDKVALGNYVRSVLNLRASNFVDENKVLESPVATIDVKSADRNYLMDFFAGGEQKYFAKRRDDGQIYEISQFNFDRINKALNELRELSVLKFDKNEIEKITLISNKKTQTIASKTNNKWEIVEPKALPKDFNFDPAAVDDFLALLSNLKADRLADDKKDKPENPEWEKSWLLEMTDKAGAKIHLFSTKIKAGKDYLVKGNIDQAHYVVKADRLHGLHEGLNAFKKEELNVPPIDENTKGFESLPVDIQRKLLDATKKKQ